MNQLTIDFKIKYILNLSFLNCINCSKDNLARRKEREEGSKQGAHADCRDKHNTLG
jgi:hypothetical protein